MSRYPDQEKALHQVQRNLYHHAHGPTAPKQVTGLTFGQLAESLQRLYAAFASPAQQARIESSISLLRPSPVDRTRCEACGLLDDDCRCTWTSP
jgi:hypothetical protein